MNPTKSKTRPLTGNHVAKELKKFFRNNGIKYLLCHRSVVPLSPKYPPLVFNFKDNYITVYNKNNMCMSVSFPCTTINTLFIKLFQHGFVSKSQIFLKS